MSFTHDTDRVELPQPRTIAYNTINTAIYTAECAPPITAETPQTVQLSSSPAPAIAPSKCIATANHVRDNLQSADVHPPPPPTNRPSRRRSIFTPPHTSGPTIVTPTLIAPSNTPYSPTPPPPRETTLSTSDVRKCGARREGFCSVLWKIITFSKAVTVTVSSGKSKYSGTIFADISSTSPNSSNSSPAARFVVVSRTRNVH
ncbi:hypothetical protein V9T40_001764 [Parthenolecanium corni]|uniref:Uncharacterized protein n=1 Tax=Parthenolecanium corni TaxID=536013 RepID=A0AAN9TW63_9HEMI